MTKNFKVTFSFENDNHLIDSTFQVIKNKIFSIEGSMYSTHIVTATVEEVLHYYNVVEDYQEDEYPRNLQILETNRERTIEGPNLKSAICAKLLRKQKVNISIEDKPKFANIGDYWSYEIVENISNLLREYQDLFPTMFS